MSAPLSLRLAGNALVGPIVWALHFLVVYASESLFCRAGSPGGHDALVAGATAAALLGVLWHGRRMWRSTERNSRLHRIQGIALWLDALSAMAITFSASSAFVIPACV